MKVGIGYHNVKDSFLNGTRVAEKAIQNSDVEKPSLALAFCGGQVDCHRFFEGVQSVLGKKVPVIGGSAIGVITNEVISYEDYPAGIVVFQFDTVHFGLASAGDLHLGEQRAGSMLARELASGRDGKLLLVFYDSVKSQPTAASPPIMNASPPLIQGIEESLGRKQPIIGAGLLGDYDFNHAHQFLGDRVDRHGVTGCLLGGAFTPYHRIMHGCTLKDGVYHTITRMAGPVIYELDGKPIVGMIDEIYDNHDWRRQMPVKRLTIGVNYGEKYGPFRESDYLNRLITGVLPDGEGVVLFEPDLSEGMEIQFMLRDPDELFESTKKNSIELLREITTDGKRPVLGLYIDCAGRTACVSDTLTEEAANIQKACNMYGVPLLGFYSGVEIAPLLGRNRGLDWTGVFLVLAKG
jgi:hypothetical protein